MKKKEAADKLWSEKRRDLVGIGVNEDDDKIYVFVEEESNLCDIPDTYEGFEIVKEKTSPFKFMNNGNK